MLLCKHGIQPQVQRAKQCGSTLESAVEEKTLGLFVPEEEEEGTIGDEIYGSLSPITRPHETGGGGSCRFSARLVHVDVGLVEEVVQPQSSAALFVDAFQIGLVSVEQMFHSQRLQQRRQLYGFPRRELGYRYLDSFGRQSK